MAHFVKAHGQLIATEFGLLCFDYVTVNLYMFVLVAYFTPTFTSVSMLESLQEIILAKLCGCVLNCNKLASEPPLVRGWFIFDQRWKKVQLLCSRDSKSPLSWTRRGVSNLRFFLESLIFSTGKMDLTNSLSGVEKLSTTNYDCWKSYLESYLYGQDLRDIMKGA